MVWTKAGSDSGITGFCFRPMIIIGLTGSIAMGKSKTAEMFVRLGIPMHDADACVHAFMKKGGKAVKAIATIFPDILENGGINRSKLSGIALNNPSNLRKLEEILHPLVKEEERKFRQACQRKRAKIAVLNIPLLFETASNKRCNLVVVASAPAFIQKQRVLNRIGMNETKLKTILAKQIPDWQKRQKADFIVQTGIGYRHSLRQVKRIIQKCGK